MAQYGREDYSNLAQPELQGQYPSQDFSLPVATQSNEPPEDFYENLAFKIKDSVLVELSNKLLEEIEGDIAARQGWETAINIVLKYLGFKIEESRTVPFIQACGAFDTTLARSLVSAYATIFPQLFPPQGPAKSQIHGVPTKEVEDEGERVKYFINYYLTEVDREYRPDSEACIMQTIFYGSGFKQVWQDTILNRPVARFIKPQDFIVNPDTENLLSAERITKVIRFDKRTIKLKERNREFKKGTFPYQDDNVDEPSAINKTINNMEGISKESQEKKSLIEFYETHTNLTDEDLRLINGMPEESDEAEEPLYLEDYTDATFDSVEDNGLSDTVDTTEEDESDDIPKPYVITICKSSEKIVSIKRNWKPRNENYEKMEHFVNYYYLKGFGIYGLGLVHLLGSNAVALTTIERQLIDAATLKNFPGGYKRKDFKAEDNNISPSPGSFIDVETGGMEPIQNGFMLMPYGEPSQVLMALRDALIQETAALAATAEKAIPENVNQNMPVGTALAYLEVNSRIQSAVLSSFHHSLGTELQLIFDLFGEHLSDEPYPFTVPGGNMVIMRKDFSDRVRICPVSDPNMLTSTHRLIRDQELMKLATQFPQLYNLREINARMLGSMNIEAIDKVLNPEPQEMALDAISENMLMITGKPVTAMPNQDHDAHIIDHLNDAMEQKMMGNIPAYASIIMHRQVHKGYKSLNILTKQVQTIEQLVQQVQMSQDFSLMQSVEEMVKKLQEEYQVSPDEVMQWSKASPKEILMIPQIQNMVSKMDAEEIQQQQQMAAQQPQPIDPAIPVLEDVKQRREAANLKHDSDLKRVELEAYKTSMGFKESTEKLETQRDLAEEKNKVTLQVEKMKQSKRGGSKNETRVPR